VDHRRQGHGRATETRPDGTHRPMAHRQSRASPRRGPPPRRLFQGGRRGGAHAGGECEGPVVEREVRDASGRPGAPLGRARTIPRVSHAVSHSLAGEARCARDRLGHGLPAKNGHRERRKGRPWSAVRPPNGRTASALARRSKRWNHQRPTPTTPSCSTLAVASWTFAPATLRPASSGARRRSTARQNSPASWPRPARLAWTSAVPSHAPSRRIWAKPAMDTFSLSSTSRSDPSARAARDLIVPSGAFSRDSSLAVALEDRSFRPPLVLQAQRATEKGMHLGHTSSGHAGTRDLLDGRRVHDAYRGRGAVTCRLAFTQRGRPTPNCHGCRRMAARRRRRATRDACRRRVSLRKRGESVRGGRPECLERDVKVADGPRHRTEPARGPTRSVQAPRTIRAK
jgi:hypothetical protein